MMDATRIFGSLNSCHQQLDGRDFLLAYVGGCFDLLHIGHMKFLRHIRAKFAAPTYRVVLGLNTDASIGLIKGPHRPINRYGDRSLMLKWLGLVDYIVPQDGYSPLENILVLRPDVLVKDETYEGGDQASVGARAVKSWGGTVYYGEHHVGISTTEILRRAAQSEKQSAGIAGIYSRIENGYA